MDHEKIAALVPALNEEKTLGSLIPEIQRWLPHVIVVDDGSTDQTAEVSKKNGAHVIVHPKNLGKGMALRSGFQYLLEKDFEGCVILDGDGQHSPQDLPSFITAVQDPKVGVVVGNRMGETATMPFVRRLTNRFMSFALSRLLQEEIPDTQCGFKFVRSDLLRVLELKASKYEIESEVLIEAKRRGFRIVSVPVHTIYGDQKSSIHPLRDTYLFLRLLYARRRHLRYEKRS
ncbi:MAG: glycosyltransferase family 2 protein [Candidatus Omnitrophica bacterium]|nr:glycosyltransferase family 2 protein [Candidatus Omnitrophota bacterium]